MVGDGMTDLLRIQVCRQLEVIPERSTQVEAALSKPSTFCYALHAPIAGEAELRRRAPRGSELTGGSNLIVSTLAFKEVCFILLRLLS